jgi:Fe-S cluster biogenesis protein NfuA/rhodanese-related sulfurtransferase
MFGNSKNQIQSLESKIENLNKKIAELKEGYEEQVKVLRQQLAGVIVGLPPTPTAIFSGLGYSEIPKEIVPHFIQNTPHLLVLDIRSDEGWNNGHIPGAKHIPHDQVYMRLMELSDKNRPILTVCPNGNTSVTIAQMLAKEGYKYVFNALGGMAGYQGELVKPKIEASDEKSIGGEDRELIRRVIEVLDRDVRPGLKRDGGDLKILAVEGGVVKIKMVGACLGCGAQKRTVEDGIITHLKKLIPEITGIEDHS